MIQKKRFHRALSPGPRAGVMPVFSDFHRLDMCVEDEYPRHRHSGYEAILVESGPYLCELNGTELRVAAGHVLIIKPGDWHADHLRRGQRHYVLHFRLETGTGARPPTLFHSTVPAGGQVAKGRFSKDSNFLDEIRREAEAKLPYAPAVQDGLLSTLFWRWVRGLDSAGLSREWRALTAIESRREELAVLFFKHIHDNPTVDDLAQEAGVSRRQFTEQCRSLIGSPPARLLLEFKLREAEALLRYQGRRVSEVSEQLGFADPFHFSRVCRRVWGFSPRDILVEGKAISGGGRAESGAT